MLYDMTDGQLTAVPGTTFAAEKVLERQHLQAALRENISVLDEDLLVVAEEFGDFEDTHRRIDLLCIDRSARLVVVELKRTEDGGHMELQSLRYAAMVSIMTFDELVATFARHLKAIGAEAHDKDAAQAQLLDWLDDVDDEPVISREVGIVLAAANFSQEITTTVLWLNEFYGMDIRCVRLAPYRHGGRLLLDVQQVIPLPEAEELMVRIKKREAAAKEGKSVSTKDRTKYVVVGPAGASAPLAKRWAILELVRTIHAAGVPAATIATAMPNAKFKSVPGTLVGEELWHALRDQHALSSSQEHRWHFDHPIHEKGLTWVVSNQWGIYTKKWLDRLLEIAPPGIDVHPIGETEQPAVAAGSTSEGPAPEGLVH